MRIHRYPLAVRAAQAIEIPATATPLSVAPGRQGYYIDMWAHVPDNAALVSCMVYVVGTGHTTPIEVNDAHFVGTCVMPDQLVWHVFIEAR